MPTAKKKGLPKKARASKKSPRANGLTRIDALELINGLDSRHQQVRPVLESLVQGKAVKADEVDALDSTHGQVQPILHHLAGTGEKLNDVTSAIESLDSFGEPLKPILVALAEGFKK